MSHLIQARDEFRGLRELLEVVLCQGFSSGPYLEVLSCLVSIGYDENAWTRFGAFRETYLKLSMPAGPLGWEKATRVYTDPRDRPTKPSYFSRLIAYPDRPKRHPARGATIDQIETIVEQLDQKPGYSCLSFVFLRPADLLDKVRPGYVPCPIAGDFKLRGGKLSLSVMFRTMDVLSVGYADIFYLRNLQRLVLTRAQEPGRNPKVSDAQVGDLNLFLSRAFITKRLGRGKDKRVSGVDTCRRLVEELRRHEG